MTRRLTGEDRKLWESLRRSVRPLRPAPEPLPAAQRPASETTASAPPEAPKPPAPFAGPPKPPAPPPLLTWEERVRRRLERGILLPDARLDLHGMHQERAFSALMTFLRRNQTRGARLVLVITGKGRGDGEGVLRQSVPAWLSRPEFRDVVAGFEEAGRRQGGAGALYVRLRRRRDIAAPAP